MVRGEQVCSYRPFWVEWVFAEINLTTLNDAELLTIEPYSVEERVFMRASKGEAGFVYMHEDVFKELNI